MISRWFFVKEEFLCNTFYMIGLFFKLLINKVVSGMDEIMW